MTLGRRVNKDVVAAQVEADRVPAVWVAHDGQLRVGRVLDLWPYLLAQRELPGVTRQDLVDSCQQDGKGDRPAKDPGTDRTRAVPAQAPETSGCGRCHGGGTPRSLHAQTGRQDGTP